LKWLEPYLELGVTMLPHGKKVVRVGAWTITNKRVGKNCQAAIYSYDDKKYKIWMHTHRHPRGEPVGPLSKIDILSNLAHELAHTISWTHTPQHKELESQISRAFMIMLKHDGYISEEEELKETV
jgi:hypothetical protein